MRQSDPPHVPHLRRRRASAEVTRETLVADGELGLLALGGARRDLLGDGRRRRPGVGPARRARRLPRRWRARRLPSAVPTPVRGRQDYQLPTVPPMAGHPRRLPPSAITSSMRPGSHPRRRDGRDARDVHRGPRAAPDAAKPASPAGSPSCANGAMQLSPRPFGHRLVAWCRDRVVRCPSRGSYSRPKNRRQRRPSIGAESPGRSATGAGSPRRKTLLVRARRWHRKLPSPVAGLEARPIPFPPVAPRCEGPGRESLATSDPQCASATRRAASARKARPRWEKACFSVGVISAKVRPSPSSGTNTGS